MTDVTTQEQSVDLAPFLAAIIHNAGGEIRVPVDSLSQDGDEESITIDLEGDGAELVFRVVPNEELPDGFVSTISS